MLSPVRRDRAPAILTPSDAALAAVEIATRTRSPKWARGLPPGRALRVRVRLTTHLLRQAYWPAWLDSAYQRVGEAGHLKHLSRDE